MKKSRKPFKSKNADLAQVLKKFMTSEDVPWSCNFFLDTCIKLQYKGFNSKFIMAVYGDETICIDKTSGGNLKFY